MQACNLQKFIQLKLDKKKIVWFSSGHVQKSEMLAFSGNACKADNNLEKAINTVEISHTGFVLPNKFLLYTVHCFVKSQNDIIFSGRSNRTRKRLQRKPTSWIMVRKCANCLLRYLCYRGPRGIFWCPFCWFILPRLEVSAHFLCYLLSFFHIFFFFWRGGGRNEIPFTQRYQYLKEYCDIKCHSSCWNTNPCRTGNEWRCLNQGSNQIKCCTLTFRPAMESCEDLSVQKKKKENKGKSKSAE